MKIVAVGMLDVAAMGRDTFFVELGPNQAMQYEVHRDGRVVPLFPQPVPVAYVTASIEKFNNGYRLDRPIEISNEGELPGYLGRFELVSPTGCRLKT